MEQGILGISMLTKWNTFVKSYILTEKLMTFLTRSVKGDIKDNRLF